MILAGSVVMSVVFWISQTLNFFMFSHLVSYSIWWIMTSYWDFLYFLIIAYIAKIWRPKEDNTRYAFIDNNEVSLESQSSTDVKLEGVNESSEVTSSSSESMSVMTLDDGKSTQRESSSTSSSF